MNDNVKKTVDKIVHICKKIATNKYLFAITIAALWFLFFDSHTILEYYDLHLEETKIQHEISYYKRISSDSQEKMSQLKTDAQSLEKFAREQFLMKKDNEDIFIIEE